MSSAEYACELTWSVFDEVTRITGLAHFEPRTRAESLLCRALTAAMNLNLLDAEAEAEVCS